VPQPLSSSRAHGKPVKLKRVNEPTRRLGIQPATLGT
jgi:hypothetical protein